MQTSLMTFIIKIIFFLLKQLSLAFSLLLCLINTFLRFSYKIIFFEVLLVKVIFVEVVFSQFVDVEVLLVDVLVVPSCKRFCTNLLLSMFSCNRLNFTSKKISRFFSVKFSNCIYTLSF